MFNQGNRVTRVDVDQARLISVFRLDGYPGEWVTVHDVTRYLSETMAKSRREVRHQLGNRLKALRNRDRIMVVKKRQLKELKSMKAPECVASNAPSATLIRHETAEAIISRFLGFGETGPLRIFKSPSADSVREDFATEFGIAPSSPTSSPCILENTYSGSLTPSSSTGSLASSFASDLSLLAASATKLQSEISSEQLLVSSTSSNNLSLNFSSCSNNTTNGNTRLPSITSILATLPADLDFAAAAAARSGIPAHPAPYFPSSGRNLTGSNSNSNYYYPFPGGLAAAHTLVLSQPAYGNSHSAYYQNNPHVHHDVMSMGFATSSQPRVA